MRAIVFLFPLILWTSLTVRAEANERTIEGSCGDHWFKVHFTANEKTKKAEIYYSGDSGESDEFTGVLVKNEDDASFRIDFNLKEKGYLYIDGADHYHNIYWGTLSKTGRPEDSVGLGLCTVY
jgi:hypothetical protein